MLKKKRVVFFSFIAKFIIVGTDCISKMSVYFFTCIIHENQAEQRMKLKMTSSSYLYIESNI